MSQSKTRLANDNMSLLHDKHDLTFKLVRLLNYVLVMQEDHPDLEWPDLPDQYSEMMWRYAA